MLVSSGPLHFSYCNILGFVIEEANNYQYKQCVDTRTGSMTNNHIKCMEST